MTEKWESTFGGSSRVKKHPLTDKQKLENVFVSCLVTTSTRHFKSCLRKRKTFEKSNFFKWVSLLLHHFECDLSSHVALCREVVNSLSYISFYIGRIFTRTTQSPHVASLLRNHHLLHVAKSEHTKWLSIVSFDNVRLLCIARRLFRTSEFVAFFLHCTALSHNRNMSR